MSDYEGKLLCRIAELERQLAAQAEDASVGKAIRGLPAEYIVSNESASGGWDVDSYYGSYLHKHYEGATLLDALRAAGLLPEKEVTG